MSTRTLCLPTHRSQISVPSWTQGSAPCFWSASATRLSPSVTKALQAKMRGSALVTFEASGHSPYWEILEEFNRVVLNFLRG